MNRPTVTDAMRLEAAIIVAEKLGEPDTADVIAKNYRHPMDGYELARELDRNEYWDLTMSDVEELDCMSSIVSRLLNDAEKKWFAENDIQPPLPIGTRIMEGVIDSVCDYKAATYRVKENGCEQQGRFLLIPFERAVAVE